jgi:hypothetical protein
MTPTKELWQTPAAHFTQLPGDAASCRRERRGVRLAQVFMRCRRPARRRGGGAMTEFLLFMGVVFAVGFAAGRLWERDGR